VCLQPHVPRPFLHHSVTIHCDIEQGPSWICDNGSTPPYAGSLRPHSKSHHNRTVCFTWVRPPHLPPILPTNPTLRLPTTPPPIQHHPRQRDPLKPQLPSRVRPHVQRNRRRSARHLWGKPKEALRKRVWELESDVEWWKCGKCQRFLL